MEQPTRPRKLLHPQLPISGCVLAGGRSSRMGTDKALLQLAGKQLIRHAVVKLSRICAEVHILSSNPALAAYASLIYDLHPGCGPLGGIEAALAHSTYDWNLVLPVDMPFLPTAFLHHWVWGMLGSRHRIRVAFFKVFGVPQPALLLIHRDAAPTVAAAIARGEFKLLPVLEATASELAPPNAPAWERVPYVLPIDENLRFGGWQQPPPGPAWQVLTPAQRSAQSLWFANLNTPEDFIDAELHADALDT